MTRATLPGTGNAGALRSLADPVASLSRVRPSQRAQRSGLRLRARLKVRANPSRKRAPVMRPDSQGTGGAAAALPGPTGVGRPVRPPRKCCDALRCSGPHARYTDRASEYSLGRKARVILLNSVVLGIEHCNYCSSTRNP